MTSRSHETFDAQAFLDSAGVARRIVAYRPSEVILAQGDPCDEVFYLQQGRVQLSVVSKAGREAIVARLGPGTFFGEGCLMGQAVHPGRAMAMTHSRVLIVEKAQMVRVLHTQRAMSSRFIAHLLTRNIRIQEDLLDQLFNSSEQRLARTLLLLAGFSTTHAGAACDAPARTIAPITQATLANMIGTTRSRVNVFMKRFEQLGLIDSTDGLTVKQSLLTVVLKA